MCFKNCFKKMLVLVIITVLLPGLVLFSASTKAEKPVEKKGAVVTIANGTLIYWKDLKKIEFDKNSPRRMKPILNFKDPRHIVQKSTAKDTVVQTSQPKGLNRNRMLLTAPVLNFAGMNMSANGAGWPPDTNGDVGINHYVQTVNTSIGIYNKSTGVLVSATTFDAFFPPAVGSPCDANNQGDPIVLFDQINQRWFILDFAWNGTADGSFYSIAASKTSDPTGAWWTYCFRADTTLMNDYPKCGVWHNGIYITANMFQFSGNYQYAKIWAIKTPDLYNGTLTAQSTTDSSYYAFSLMPSNARGTTAPASTTPNYMFSQDADEFGAPSTDSLKVWKYSVNWVTPANTTWTGPTSMATAAYGMVGTGIPQLGSGVALDSLSGRLMYSAVYRKFPTYEAVYLSHTAESGSNRAVRWYEIRISGGATSIYQQGTYSPDTSHRWMSSICADKNASIALGYSVGSSSMYPAIRYAGRLSTDTLGTMGQGEQTLIAGTGSQTSYSRWGDYSMLSIDPVDDETFWYTTEYLSATGTNWLTRVGSFKISTTTPPAVSLAEALDYLKLQIATSGNGAWTAQTATYYYGNDAAQSPVISHSQSATMITSISGKTTVRFWWKVSSEANYDFLKFYIDDVLQHKISGTTDWAQKVYTVTTGSHSLKWVYSKSPSVSSGSDAGWVDKLELSDTIADALDNINQSFTLSGNGIWAYQTGTTYYGGDAAQSPVISHSQSATMATTISGKTTVRFWWKVSSETNYDFLKFYIDDVLQHKISGVTEWAEKAYAVTSGTHTLKWIYSKDSSGSSNSDTGWVDKLELSDAIAGALDIANQTFICSGNGNWISQTATSYYGGDAAQSAEITHLQSASMETTISGKTTVKFWWKVSSEASYDYLKFYIDGVLQHKISGTTDWAQRVYTVTTGSHILQWRYSKDSSVSSDLDTGWVDKLELL